MFIPCIYFFIIFNTYLSLYIYFHSCRGRGVWSWFMSNIILLFPEIWCNYNKSIYLLIPFNSINPLMIPEGYFVTPILNKFMNMYMFSTYQFSKGFIDYANANEFQFCLLLLTFSFCQHAFTSVDLLPFINNYIWNLFDQSKYLLLIVDKHSVFDYV